MKEINNKGNMNRNNESSETRHALEAFFIAREILTSEEIIFHDRAKCVVVLRKSHRHKYSIDSLITCKQPLNPPHQEPPIKKNPKTKHFLV